MLSKLFSQEATFETKEQEEFRRLIDREKRMIDRSKIILVEQVPAVAKKCNENNSDFLNMLIEGADVVNPSLHIGVSKSEIDGFQIPMELLEESFIREYYMLSDDIKSQDLFKFIGELAKPALWEMKETSDMFDGVETPEEMARTFPFLAVFVEDYFKVVSLNTMIGNNVDRKENASITADKGQDVLDFWQDVREMKDYSGLFPEKPKPDGNRPDDGAGKVKLWDWVKGGLQPSPGL